MIYTKLAFEIILAVAADHNRLSPVRWVRLNVSPGYSKVYLFAFWHYVLSINQINEKGMGVL